MKEAYLINKISMVIVHAGLGLCSVVSAAILFYTRAMLQKNILSTVMIENMIERTLISVLFVIIAAMISDIYLKRQNLAQ